MLHLNALQEALQPEGQLNFRGLLPKIARVVEALDVPVVVKEIGCGISAAVGRELANVGVRILDTAGVGGTSWARIEAARADEVALGADLAGMAVPVLEAANASTEAVVDRISRTAFELRVCMFCTGAVDLAALRRVPLLRETGDG